MKTPFHPAEQFRFSCTTQFIRSVCMVQNRCVKVRELIGVCHRCQLKKAWIVLYLRAIAYVSEYFFFELIWT